jgi:hypothetical protein
MFAAGGPGHMAMLGLLLAGVSVPAAFAHLMPRWLIWLRLIAAVIAELATLSLIVPVLEILLPLARFLALLWMIGTGFTMPRFGALPTAVTSARSGKERTGGGARPESTHRRSSGWSATGLRYELAPS